MPELTIAAVVLVMVAVPFAIVVLIVRQIARLKAEQSSLRRSVEELRGR
jgi:hypothetical protein